jgi:hypothetical protein
VNIIDAKPVYALSFCYGRTLANFDSITLVGTASALANHAKRLGLVRNVTASARYAAPADSKTWRVSYRSGDGHLFGMHVIASAADVKLHADALHLQVNPVPEDLTPTNSVLTTPTERAQMWVYQNLGTHCDFASHEAVALQRCGNYVGSLTFDMDAGRLQELVQLLTALGFTYQTGDISESSRLFTGTADGLETDVLLDQKDADTINATFYFKD